MEMVNLLLLDFLLSRRHSATLGVSVDYSDRQSPSAINKTV